MGRSATLSGTHRSRNRGFSMVELAVSMTVLLILTAIAIPSFMRSIRTYQLNDAAGRVSDILKFTRFEAVRRNTAVTLQIQQPGTGWNVWTDSNGDAVEDPTEKQILITGFASLWTSAGLPNPAPITTALKVLPSALKTLSGNPGSVTFDSRGAVRVGGVITTNVYIIYVGAIDSTDNTKSDPQFGYRAVVVLPAGGTQVWTAPPGGTWQRIG